MTEDVMVVHGSCLDVLPTLEAGSVDAVVTDPPYGTQANKDGYGRRGEPGGIGRFIEGDSDLSLMGAMLAEAARVLKPNCWVAVFCSPKRHAEAADILKGRGFAVAGEVIWDKASPGLGGGIRYQHETVLLGRRGNATGHAQLFSVIRSHVSRADKHLKHPHEKPLNLIRDLVCYVSRPGDLILDPFAGSGTTPLACLKSGRRCLAVEVADQYIPLINRRLKSAETPLFQGLGVE